MRQSLYTLLIAVLMVTSCKKTPIGTNPEPEGIDSTATVSFINVLDDSVTVSLSGLDLATGVIPHVFTVIVPPKDSLVLQPADLGHKYAYKYSWQTADQRHASWFLFNNQADRPDFGFAYFADSTDRSITLSSAARNDKRIAIGGNGSATNWVAVDAYDSTGASVWNGLLDWQQYKKLRITEYYTVKHTVQNAQYKITSINPAFRLYDTTAKFSLATTAIDSFILTTDLGAISPRSTAAEDTLYFSAFHLDTATGKIVHPGPFFKMARVSVE